MFIVAADGVCVSVRVKLPNTAPRARLKSDTNSFLSLSLLLLLPLVDLFCCCRVHVPTVHSSVHIFIGISIDVNIATTIDTHTQAISSP